MIILTCVLFSLHFIQILVGLLVLIISLEEGLLVMYMDWALAHCFDGNMTD